MKADGDKRSFWLELSAIVLLVFGPSIVVSTAHALNPVPIRMSDYSALIATFDRVTRIGGGLLFLHLRGYSLSRLMGNRDIYAWLAGVVIPLFMMILSVISHRAVDSFFSSDFLAAYHHLRIGHVSPAMTIVDSSIVGIIEEVFLTGYVLSEVSRRFNWKLALFISTCVRASYHTYQGPHGVASCVAFGLLVSAVSLWQRSALPAITSHALWDIWAFSQYW